MPSTLINCENCVFAFFKDKKTFGSKVSDYVKDYSTLKDNQGYQRRRFLGLILDSNGTRYTCTRVDETNGDTRRDGYVSVHIVINMEVIWKK